MILTSAALSAGEIAVGALGKAAIAERGKRQFSSNAGGRDDVLYDAPQISKVLPLRSASMMARLRDAVIDQTLSVEAPAQNKVRPGRCISREDIIRKLNGRVLSQS